MPGIEKKPNIVAFTGAHGTGKTTAVFDLAARIKKARSGNVGILQETARDCPFPVLSVDCKQPSERSQLWIFTAHVNRELSEAPKYDWLISDRTCVDCIAYTVFSGHTDLADAMMAMARRHIVRYHTVIFRHVRENPYCVADGFRSVDYRIRSQIEDILLNLYAELGVALTSR